MIIKDIENEITVRQNYLFKQKEYKKNTKRTQKEHRKIK
jgi:hypothetical protein